MKNAILFSTYGMTAPCHHCGSPVREGIKFCDPYCSVSYKAKQQGAK